MHHLRRTAFAALLACAATLTVAAPSWAAGWTDAETLSVPGKDAYQADAALDAEGNTWFVWTRDIGTGSSRSSTAEARRVAADGTIGPTITLDSGVNTSQSVDDAQVVVDDAGVATVTWIFSPGFLQGRVRAATITPAGAVDALGDVTAAGAWSPDLAIAPDGTALLAWSYDDDVHARTIAPGGDLGDVVTVDDAGSDQYAVTPQIAAGPAGGFTVVWVFEDYVDGDDQFQEYRYRRVSASGVLAPGGHHVAHRTSRWLNDPDVAANAAGDVALGWDEQLEEHGWRSVVHGVRIAADGDAGEVRRFSDADLEGWIGDVAADSSGAFTYAFEQWDWDAGAEYLGHRSLLPGDTLGPLHAAATDVESPMLAFDGDDRPVAAWVADGDVADHVLTTARLDGSSLLDRSALTPDTGDTDIALDDGLRFRGDTGVVHWKLRDPTRSGLEQYVVQASFWDAVGPVVSKLLASDKGAPGQTLVFGAEANDRSGVGSLSWDFGNGATAEGSVVSTSYAEPGNYTVRLTATDGTGNSTTEERVVEIAAPGAGGGDGTGAPPAGDPPGGTPQGGDGPGAGGGGGLPSLDGFSAPRTLQVARNGSFVLTLPQQPVNVFGLITVDPAGAKASAAAATRLGLKRFMAFDNTPVRVRVKLNRKGLRTLRKRGKVRARVGVTLRSVTDQRSSRSSTITLKAPRRR